jgi:FixJ family two-component response regulator
MSNADATVFVVDDDPPVLKATARVLRSLGLNVVTFESPREFLDGYDAGVTGCLLLDLSMPDLDGLELQQALADRGGTTPIIFLSGHGDVPSSVRAMKRGACDFLTKPADEKELIGAVRSAIEKDRSARSARRALADIQRRLDSLTAREREVLEHVVAGRLNKQIASDLGTVEKTIKVHRARVMEKMEVVSLAELVQLAQRVGIVAPAHAC